MVNGYTIFNPSVYFVQRIGMLLSELTSLAAENECNTIEKILAHYVNVDLSKSLQADTKRKMKGIDVFPRCNTKIASAAFFLKLREYTTFVQDFMREALATGQDKGNEHDLLAATFITSTKDAKPQHWHMDGTSSATVLLFH